jgi:hypothetical protein
MHRISGDAYCVAASPLMLQALKKKFMRSETAHVASHQHRTDGLVAQNPNFNFDDFAAQNFLIRYWNHRQRLWLAAHVDYTSRAATEIFPRRTRPCPFAQIVHRRRAPERHQVA